MEKKTAKEEIKPKIDAAAKNGTGEKLSDNYKLLATGSFATIFGVGLLILVFFESNSNEYATTLLICLSGCLLGWVIGIITSPYGKPDADNISKFTKLIGTFLSGYILAKMDKIFENFLSVKNVESSFSGLSGIRILFFLCYFLLTWVVVFVYRQYATGYMPRG